MLFYNCHPVNCKLLNFDAIGPWWLFYCCYCYYQGPNSYQTNYFLIKSEDSLLVKQNRLKFFEGSFIWTQRNLINRPKAQFIPTSSHLVVDIIWLFGLYVTLFKWEAFKQFLCSSSGQYTGKRKISHEIVEDEIEISFHLPIMLCCCYPLYNMSFHKSKKAINNKIAVITKKLWRKLLWLNKLWDWVSIHSDSLKTQGLSLLTSLWNNHNPLNRKLVKTSFV